MNDTGKTCLIRAIEHVERRMWLPGADGIPVADQNRVDAVNILRMLEMSIDTTMAWCCSPWSTVVARAHAEIDMIWKGAR